MSSPAPPDEPVGRPPAADTLLEQARRAAAAGNLDLARRSCDGLLAAYPGHAGAHYLMAALAERTGDAAGAARHLRTATIATPGWDEPWLALAALMRAAGDDAGAAAALAGALAASPADPDTWYDLANARLGLGLADQAVHAYRRSLRAAPGHRAAAHNLALTLAASHRVDEALGVLAGALAHSPAADALWRLSAQYRLERGDPRGAFEALERALALAPDVLDAELCRGIGAALRDGRHFEDAVRLIRHGLRLHPANATLLHHLGVTFGIMHERSRAAACFRHAILLDPAHPFALNSHGIDLCTLGLPEAGVRALERALLLEPYHTALHSNLALNIQYDPGASRERILEVHRLWDRRHGSRWLPPADDWQPTPFKRLRIGYVSPDFGQHPVGFFLRGVIPNHDRAAFEVFCYSNRADEDPMTTFFKANADHWVPCASLSHAELADRIRRDRIDILVDLAGHTQGNRLPVFAVKPAPVQATWAGYVGTTGLSAMDYLISDARQSPPEHDRWTVETVVRLPDCYVCYDPPPYAPDIGPPPFRRNGFVTFGCFNNLAKINDGVIALWSELLRGRPDRRLRLQTHALGDPRGRRRIREAFAVHGVGADQLDLHDGAFHRQLLEAYGEVDVALDPFPYSGGLTTLESLWMGVPVVTLAGKRFCSRHSLSHLTAAGVPELAVDDAPGYLALADALADAPGRLDAYRSMLRPRMAASALLDLPGFTRNLERALRRMWQRWCMLNG